MSELVATDLSKRYHGRLVVDGVSLKVAPGEIVGLLGPNGAGKTTTFNIVAGLVRADGGTVALGPHALTALPVHLRARLGLGYLAQEPTIFRKLSVRENFLAALELSSTLGRPERERQADAALDECGLRHVADAKGETLSGGERRRAEIARTLLARPSVVLFDEPFAGVDPLHVAELQAAIAALKARGLGVLITDHNARDTLRICDRAYVIAGGKILEQGTPQAIASSSKARSVYLGESFSLS